MGELLDMVRALGLGDPNHVASAPPPPPPREPTMRARTTMEAIQDTLRLPYQWASESLPGMVADALGISNFKGTAADTPVDPHMQGAMTFTARLPHAELVEKLAPIDRAAPEIRNAVEYLAKRFPRLMSHVSAINASPLNTVPGREGFTVQGRVLPEIHAKFPRLTVPAPEGAGMRGPLAMIQYDKHAIKGDELKVLAHELAHVGQTVRQTEIAQRIPTEPNFTDLYGRMTKAQGYHNNPMEVSARETADSVLAKQHRFAPRNVAERMWDAVGGDSVKVEERLRQVFPGISDAQVLDALRSARKP